MNFYRVALSSRKSVLIEAENEEAIRNNFDTEKERILCITQVDENSWLASETLNPKKTESLLCDMSEREKEGLWVFQAALKRLSAKKDSASIRELMRNIKEIVGH